MDRDEFIKRVIENYPTCFHDDIIKIISNESNTFEIFKTDAAWDAGDYRYVVSMPDVDDDYWINSFYSFDDAVEFCDALELKWSRREKISKCERV